ncbi:MAG: ureidoglycolate lyase [Granulosicoccus sp.]
MHSITAEPLLEKSFSAYGDVIERGENPSTLINQGNCERYNDLVTLDFYKGRVGISVFRATPYTLPVTLPMMERHPLGTQAFIPLDQHPFLVVVADDLDGSPSQPRVFLTNGRQGVNYARNTWHGVLTPITGEGLFVVIDRIGDGDNLEEHWFERSYQITL